MSTSEFDLDINNYSIKDLEKFFKLNPKKQYSANDIETKEYTIREQLLTSGHVDKRFKADLIVFLSSAKDWLIRVKCAPAKTPSIIPENYRLDTDPDYPRSKSAMSREHELIEHPKQQFVYTQNSDYFPGKLNPLEKRTLTRNLSIDTLFRTQTNNKTNNSKSTDFIYVLPEPLNNVTSVKLTSMELPQMWYDFASANYSNQMTINLYNMAGVNDKNGVRIINISHTIRLPEGNYDSASFPLAMNNYFNNVNNGLQLLIVEVNALTSNTIIRTQNPITEPLSLLWVYQSDSYYHSPRFYFEIDFSVKEDPSMLFCKTMGWTLGFRHPFYTVDIHNSYIDATVVSPSFVQIDMSGAIFNNTVNYQGYLRSESSFGSNITNYVFLDVDDFNNNFPTNTIISANSMNSTYLGNNILARITLTSNAFTIFIDTAQSHVFKKREYFGPIKLEKMRIRLLNKYGDVIDLMDNDYSFLLEITQLYT